MKFTIQLAVGDGQSQETIEIALLDKHPAHLEDLGWTLAERRRFSRSCSDRSSTNKLRYILKSTARARHAAESTGVHIIGGTPIENNRALIPNYGERYRYGEAIATGFVESTINQVVAKRFCKKQQMQWTPRGAHLLLQTRTRVLNGELASRFREWYPNFSIDEPEEYRLAA
jgi:hypothetical protein